MAITVDKKKCPQNHACPAIKVCPADALSQKEFEAPVVDKDACLDCGACSNFCPMGALELV